MHLQLALCVSHQALKTLSPNARIVLGPRQRCTNSTTFVVNNAFPGTYRVVTHASCICNEVRALYNRHLVDRTHIAFEPEYFKKMARKVLRELPTADVPPVSYTNIINGYHGAKRNAYLRARENIKINGFDKRWTYVKMFVKPDKYPEDNAMDKAPRAIQYRSPEFNLLIGKYLKPIEEEFYSMLSPGGFRFVAKGLNNIQRAKLLQAQSNTFLNPCYILLDHSAFDSTINVTHLRETHKFYRKMNKSRQLQNLLKYQINNKGFSKHGIKYTIKGTRMSGDYDTALGNTFVNYVCLRSWLRINNVRGEIMLDGDDSIVTVERASLSRLDPAHFTKCGFETKMEVVYNLSEVEFCQSKYLPTEPPRFSRNPLRALSRLNISIRDYHGRGWYRYQAGVGLGEMATNQGVPILYEVGKKLASLSRRPIFDSETCYKVQVEMEELPITDEVRDAYYLAWGITPSQQIAIESSYTPYLRARPSELIQQFLSLPTNAETQIW